MSNERHREPCTNTVITSMGAVRPMAAPASLLVLCFLAIGLLPAESAWSQTMRDRTVTSATSPDAEVPTVADRLMRTQAPMLQYASPSETCSTTDVSTRRIKPGTRQNPPASLRLHNNLTERLWQSRMAAPDPNEDIETRRALAQLIRQIRSVQFEPTRPSPAFDVPTESYEPDEFDAPEPLREEPWKIATKPARISAPAVETALPTQTAEALKRLVQNPDRVQEPLELAELLFLSARRAEAAVLYQKALDRVDMNAATAHEDRAWILFQLGNCLRETDMIRARDMYVKLIAEYPESPWTELAKAHGRLITWYQKARPGQLLNQPKP